MDSINKNQPEENHQDLSGKDAVKKLKDIVKDADTCFFCTRSSGEGSGGNRPMSMRQVDEQGNILGFAVEGVSQLKPGQPLEAELAHA